ncbi:MAG TPA: hypothetical protein VEP90_27860 [Methylomirabilota bacterium]|nr:hypothetical protein [Methylomirabilota bacterium]
MTQWYVELICKESKLLAFLSSVFQEPSCTVIARETDFYTSNLGFEPELSAEKTSGYFLLSTDFESCTEVIEVLQRAENILPLLNGIMKLKYAGCLTAVQLGAVYRPDTVGRMIQQRRIVVTLTRYPKQRTLQSANTRPPTLVDLWQVAWNNREVAEAMHHFANQRNWFNLFKVYEVIEDKVGKETLNKWTQGRAEDFTYSANNASVSGYDARHFSARFKKPSPKRTPMTLNDATYFIAALLSRWIQTNYLKDGSGGEENPRDDL